MKPNLVFHKASEFDANVKATAHRSGKLGFSENAIKKLNLDENRFLQIATNGDDENDHTLYVIVQNKESPDCFRVTKSGEYYYAATKPLFDKLGVDYRNLKVIYDIVDVDYEGERYYKFVRRDIKRKETKT